MDQLDREVIESLSEPAKRVFGKNKKPKEKPGKEKGD